MVMQHKGSAGILYCVVLLNMDSQPRCSQDGLMRHVVTRTAFLLVTWLSLNHVHAHDEKDWSTYNYDFRGSRHNVAEERLSVANVGTLEIKWQFPPKDSTAKVGAINATPAVVNGYVYFGTSTYPTFYKLKPNGEIKWTYELGGGTRRLLRRSQETIGLVPRFGVYSSALVTEDSVYFGDVLGVAYCLDRDTGKERWTVNSKAKDFPGAA